MRRWCRFGMGIRVSSDGVAINQTTPTPIASEKVSSNVAAAFAGKRDTRSRSPKPTWSVLRSENLTSPACSTGCLQNG